MSQLTRAAFAAAVALSVLSVTDAVLRGASDTLPPWDPEVSAWWVTPAITLLEVATLLLLAGVLVERAAALDRGGVLRRWTRRALAVDLAVVSAGVTVAQNWESSVFETVAGIGFAGMFLLGIVLGAEILPRWGWRLPASLMIAPLGLIPLAFAVDAVAPGWGHPGYAETALYVGLALLGARADHEALHSREPARVAVG